MPFFFAIAALVLAIAAAAGPIGTAAGFEDDDGNLTPAAPTNFDWNSFAPVTWTGTPPFRQADKTVSDWVFKGLEDDQASTADSGFAGGTKQDDNCATVIAAKAPNKDDLKRVYLATKVVNNQVFLTLAWVRIPQNSVSASAHIGFEFNKGATPCGASSGGLVQRSAGDMLIVYDFEGGSNPPTLTVRRWVTSGACEVSSNSAPCWGIATDLTGSAFAEAAVNFAGPVSDAVAPSAPPSESLGKVEFGEAGINLTAAGVFGTNTCVTFGKSYAVSRSSGSSGTAQMKDLVGPGNFNLSNCNATLVTDPKNAGGNSVAGQTIQPGTSVTDLATITGTNNAGTPPTPTGSVAFSLCGPSDPSSTDLCTTGGTTVSTNQVSPGQTQGTATATSAAVNTAQSPLLPGRYCFRADYTSGDTNYGSLSHVGTANSECFIVAKLPSTTATSSTPTGGSIVPGTSASDTATITPTGGTGPTPTGTVDFYLCQPNELTNGACPSGGTLISDDVQLVNGSATSASTTNTNAIGTYCWRAVYSGDAVYLPSSHTNSTTECFTTVKQPSQTLTTSSPTGGGVTPGTSVTDTATVSGSGPTPTGTVTFFLCSPSQVLANSGDCSAGGLQIGSPVGLVNGSATSAAANPANVGKYCWRAEYSGDGFYLTSNHTNSTTECFTVQDSTAITSAQEWLPNDSATVSATGGTPLNGTLSITLYESSDCTGDAVQNQSYSKPLTNATSAADRTLATSNGTYKVLASKSVSWKTVFTSTDANVSGQTHCETTSLTITN